MSLGRARFILIATCAVAAAAGCASIDRKQPDKELVPEHLLEIEVHDARLDISPAHIEGGHVDIDMVNQGQLEHVVRIEGKGLDEPFDTSVAPGQRRRMALRLKPGTYRVFCPDANHADLGITGSIDVDEEPTNFHR